MTSRLAIALVELERDKVIASVRERTESGEDPLRILEECREGMTTVGELYQKGDYYLAELMLSADIFKSALTAYPLFCQQLTTGVDRNQQ